jgi:hypothetical protein
VLRRAVLLAPLVLLGPAAGARADEEEVPREVPVAIEAEVDDRALADTASCRLVLRFTPSEDVARAYRVELRLVRGADEVLVLDHAPAPPTTSWKSGQSVTYDVPVPLPLEGGLRPGDTVVLLAGFFDVAAEKAIPAADGGALRGTRREVGRLAFPALGPVTTEEQVQSILARARELGQAGQKPLAWRALELGLRRAVEDETKTRFRDGILSLGHFPPAPVSVLERQIVEKRIADERRRFLRLQSGRAFDRGQLFAALRLLEVVGGTLEEEADGAVIGALADAERAEKDALDLKVRILARVTEEDTAKAEAAAQSLGMTKALLQRAEAWAAERLWGRARLVLRKLSLSGERDLAEAARAKSDEVDRLWLADTPPDEQKVVDQALNEPAFQRIATVATHHFVYIGPRTLVEGIPDEARLRFDLAYVFLTDLFGRIPNPGGDRITVFFKELWDFGGGVGGGKTIDIGSAKPDQRGYRVDNGLLYHELTHCVDDTDPIFQGFREGLANFGAVYAYEALGQQSDSLHGFETNLEAFEEDYLARDLEYWRIQNYGPSAGFFLHFLKAYSRRGAGHDWKPYRKFFRRYREAPVRDGRDPYVARALAFYLVEAFGEKAFDDLIRFRFPLVESDRAALAKELDAFVGYVRDGMADEMGEHPRSPLPRDLRAREMVSRARSRAGEEEARRIGREELGILYDWWVIGPFRERGVDPGACVFPPERELDLAKEYPSDNNVCAWRRAGETGVVTLDATGWVGIGYAYQDDTATYALTHVTVPEDVQAVAHLRTDDDFTLFVNGEMVEGYTPWGWNGSSGLWWRGPVAQVPDAQRLPVPLRRGRNEILLKVRNRAGPAGFVLALATEDGRAVPGLVADLDPPAAPGTTTPPERRWKRATHQAFRARGAGRSLETTVGEFAVDDQRLVGQDTAGRVAWRKYTVRPGFPKDSPSNLAWLKAKETEGAAEARLTLELVGRGAPKICVTLQGDGGTDGLSGWTLILHPSGGDRVQARLERYDRLVYETPPLELPTPKDPDDPVPLVATLAGARFSATYGSLVLFDEVPIRPIPGRTRVGFATWGRTPAIASLELEVPRDR